jgi:hypothetical protein
LGVFSCNRMAVVVALCLRRHINQNIARPTNTARPRIPPMTPPAQPGKLVESPSEFSGVARLSMYHVAIGWVYVAAKTSLREVLVQYTGEVRVAPPEELQLG